MNEIKVVELFAGVGGFRVGLERVKSKKYKTIFASQFEPSRTKQFAYECYKKNFGDTFDSMVNSHLINKDIYSVESKDIPKHDMLVGGFPCQDYSVATTKAKGLEGKKGVLWWTIYRILKDKKPKFILLENVDRLLKSPTSNRGRDFAIMLKCLDELGYTVEWKVINAAEYGNVQRRRRVFIFGTLKGKIKLPNKEELLKSNDFKFTTLEKAFPSKINEKKIKDIFEIDFKKEKSKWFSGDFEKDLQYISDNYNKDSKTFGEMFRTSGIMTKGKVISYDTTSTYEGNEKHLIDILEKKEVDKKYFLNLKQNKQMEEARAAKKKERVSKTGHAYIYSEGKMNYPDELNKPGRTMLTSEGTVNRSSHIVNDYKKGKKRFITPIEAERLNGFPDNWTEGMTDRERYFCMGNALVVDLITKIGEEIS